MNELPTGWVEVPIGSFARIVGGGTPPAKDPANFAMPGQGIPWITPADLSGVRKQTIERGSRDLTPAGLAACGATVMPAGTVLFSSRAPIGYVAIAANDIATNQGFKSFILPGGIEPRFAYHQLKHLKSEAESIATGTTFKELSGAAAATLPFCVAPAQEQVRIADQLDSLLARIQGCVSRLDAIPPLLGRFRKAVISAAVTGQLTSSWRSENESKCQRTKSGLWPIPAQWRWANAEDECGFITKGTTPSKEKMHSGSGDVPFIKVYNLGFDGHLDFTINPTFVGRQTHAVELKRSIAHPGDVLMNIVGPPLGKVAVVPDTHPEWNINQAIARFRPGSNLRSEFLACCLLSSDLVEYTISKSKATAGQRNLTLEICRALPIPIPSLDEQDEITRQLRRLFGIANEIEALYTAAVKNAKRLAPLTLAKAFRGELVQQNPQEEPASILLQRIAGKQHEVLKTMHGRPRVQKPETVEVLPVALPDWSTLPTGAWAAQVPADEHTATAQLIAALKAWNKPMPQDTARLATLLCLQPRLLTAALPADHAAQWRRLVGDTAAPLPAQVVTLQPAFNTPWRNAISKMRARGDLVESGSGAQGTWALGPDAARIDTAGWPEGRAGWVVHYLQKNGVEAVLPTLATEVKEFVHARAA